MSAIISEPWSTHPLFTPSLLSFLAALHRLSEETRRGLMHDRVVRQAAIDQGGKSVLVFLPETEHVRSDSSWTCAPPAPGLVDRRVELTGPMSRKLIISALNSGASCFMADSEDSTSPSFSNIVQGQVNLRDAVVRNVDFTDSATGKEYKLADKTATLIFRTRGWHLLEPRVTVDGQPMSGAVFDFGMYFFLNAANLIASGAGPYFYSPKMESYLEARLWCSVFSFAEEYMNIPTGSIRTTCLIETLPAAYQMEEILYELRDYSSGLNCGRWDYIFSTIKTLRADPTAVLPDRADVSMTVPFMAAYVTLLIQTCHRRKVAAMGGMSAQIPIKNNETANTIAMNKVKADKLREVKAGHDGTWVAHPALVKIAMDIFDEHMPTPNQYSQIRSEITIKEEDLSNTAIENGRITINGVRENASAALAYISAWISGNGCVPINNLMEDAATSEIARVQLWQWVHYASTLENGVSITAQFVEDILLQEAVNVENLGYSHSAVELARNYISQQIVAAWPSDFLTSDLMHSLPDN